MMTKIGINQSFWLNVSQYYRYFITRVKMAETIAFVGRYRWGNQALTLPDRRFRVRLFTVHRGRET